MTEREQAQFLVNDLEQSARNYDAHAVELVQRSEQEKRLAGALREQAESLRSKFLGSARPIESEPKT
jgi:hypothetical protein